MCCKAEKVFFFFFLTANNSHPLGSSGSATAAGGCDSQLQNHVMRSDTNTLHQWRVVDFLNEEAKPPLFFPSVQCRVSCAKSYGAPYTLHFHQAHSTITFYLQ